MAAGAAGVGQAVERFDFRNAERAAAQVEQRALPQIIGRPADAEQLIMRAGQRAQKFQRAAAADIEQFAAEQAAAQTAEITPLLAETGAAAAETGGLAAVATGAAEALGGAAAAALAPEVAIPAALGLVAGAGGAMLAGRSEAGTQTEPPRGSGVAAAAGGALEGVRAGASAFPTARNIGRAGGAAVGGLGAAALGLGMGAVGGAYQGARYMLGGGDAASSSGSEFQDVRTLNGMQQGAPQERISVRQPRVQQPMVSRLNSSEDDAPTAQQEQPRPQVRSRPPHSRGCPSA